MNGIDQTKKSREIAKEKKNAQSRGKKILHLRWEKNSNDKYDHDGELMMRKNEKESIGE